VRRDILILQGCNESVVMRLNKEKNWDSYIPLYDSIMVYAYIRSGPHVEGIREVEWNSS
jgi:hypothetical protein